MLKDAIDFHKINSVLIVKLRHHGDVLLTSPVFQVLKENFPHLQLDALVYLDTAPMLTLNPYIDQIHTIDRNWKKQGLVFQLKSEYHLMKTLLSRQYDLIITLTEHHRGAVLARFLRPTLSVAPKGRKGAFFQKSFTHLFPVLKGNSRHTVEMHLDALRRLGLTITPPPLRFVPGKEAYDNVDRYLAEHGLKENSFLLFHPTSRWSFKTWNVDQTSQLIQHLNLDNYPIVITAAPDKQELAFVSQLEEQCPGQFINMAGKLSLKELGGMIDRSRLFIGFDSVPAHISAAMQTPAIVLFGPSGEHEWHPWQSPHRLLVSPISCRPCGQAGCGNGWQSDCLRQISILQVIQEVKTLWHA